MYINKHLNILHICITCIATLLWLHKCVGIFAENSFSNGKSLLNVKESLLVKRELLAIPTYLHSSSCVRDCPCLRSGLPDDIFNPKIPIWVNFGGSSNGRCWYILWPYGLYYCDLVYYVDIWYLHIMVIWYIFPVLVCCTKKNLAILS
jgi:hypothetical protein